MAGQFKGPPQKQLGSGSAPLSKPVMTAREAIAHYRRRSCRLMGLSDATGSMSSVWTTTRGQIAAMLKRISELGEIRVNWVAYRDYSEEQQLLESSGWKSGAAELLPFIERIDCFGGNDFEEAVERALQFAADDADASRVVLIGDAPPHPERDYLQQAGRLAALNRPVYSFVVGSAPQTVKAFAKISEITGGMSTILRSEQDLIDCIGFAMAEDIGGENTVREYLERHRRALSPGAVDYAMKMLDSGRK